MKTTTKTASKNIQELIVHMQEDVQLFNENAKFLNRWIDKRTGKLNPINKQTGKMDMEVCRIASQNTEIYIRYKEIIDEFKAELDRCREEENIRDFWKQQQRRVEAIAKKLGYDPSKIEVGNVEYLYENSNYVPSDNMLAGAILDYFA